MNSATTCSYLMSMLYIYVYRCSCGHPYRTSAKKYMMQFLYPRPPAAEAVLAIRPGRPWPTQTARVIPMIPTYTTPVGLPKICLAFDWPTQMKIPRTAPEQQLLSTCIDLAAIIKDYRPHRRNFRGGDGSGPPTFWTGRTDPPVYKYTKSEIFLGPPHFSDQSYATVGQCHDKMWFKCVIVRQ